MNPKVEKVILEKIGTDKKALSKFNLIKESLISEAEKENFLIDFFCVQKDINEMLNIKPKPKKKVALKEEDYDYAGEEVAHANKQELEAYNKLKQQIADKITTISAKLEKDKDDLSGKKSAARLEFMKLLKIHELELGAGVKDEREETLLQLNQELDNFIKIYNIYEQPSINKTKLESLTMKKRIIKEYFVNELSTIGEAFYAQNVVNDTSVEDGLTIENDIEWAGNPQVVEVLNKYKLQVEDLEKKLAPFFNKGVPKQLIEKLDQVYDGSDAYDDETMFLEHMPEVYDSQIRNLNKLYSVMTQTNKPIKEYREEHPTAQGGTQVTVPASPTKIEEAEESKPESGDFAFQAGKDVFQVKAFDYEKGKNLAVAVLAKFREEFQSALEAAGLGDSSVILTFEMGGEVASVTEEKPEAEEEESKKPEKGVNPFEKKDDKKDEEEDEITEESVVSSVNDYGYALLEAVKKVKKNFKGKSFKMFTENVAKDVVTQAIKAEYGKKLGKKITEGIYKNTLNSFLTKKK